MFRDSVLPAAMNTGVAISKCALSRGLTILQVPAESSAGGEVLGVLSVLWELLPSQTG